QAFRFKPHVRALLLRDRALWTIRMQWKDGIDCEVRGSAEPAADVGAPTHPSRLVSAGRRFLSSLVSKLVKPSPMTVELILNSLCCPTCRGDLDRRVSHLACHDCNRQYGFNGRTVDFEHPTSVADPRATEKGPPRRQPSMD